MVHASHSSAPINVPADLVADRRAGWHAFTRFVVINCVAVIGILVLLLLIFKVF